MHPPRICEHRKKIIKEYVEQKYTGPHSYYYGCRRWEGMKVKVINKSANSEEGNEAGHKGDTKIPQCLCERRHAYFGHQACFPQHIIHEKQA